MAAIGRPEPGADRELAGNTGRVAHVEKIDEAIGQGADAVLRETGLSPEQIKILKDQGIVAEENR